MTRMRRPVLLLAVPMLTAASQTAQAQTGERDAPDPTPFVDPDDRWRFRDLEFIIENDGAGNLINSDDQHYSSGVRITISLDPSARFEEGVRGFLDRVLEVPDARVAAGVTLAHHIYTPEDITLPNPPTTDRPFAGYFAVGFFVNRTGPNVHDHLGVEIGVTGHASFAEPAQIFVHSALPDQVKPRGWRTQLSDELTIQTRLQRTWRWRVSEGTLFDVEVLPRVAGELGTVFIRATGEVTGRVGYNLPDDFGPSRVLDKPTATARWAGDWGMYVFGRATGRAVARNMFLDGNLLQNSRSVDREELVGEVAFGLVGRWRWLEAGYAITILTDEFETQTASDSYATLFARVSVDF